MKCKNCNTEVGESIQELHDLIKELQNPESKTAYAKGWWDGIEKYKENNPVGTEVGGLVAFTDKEAAKELYDIVNKHLNVMGVKKRITLPIMIGEIMEVISKFGTPMSGFAV